MPESAEAQMYLIEVAREAGDFDRVAVMFMSLAMASALARDLNGLKMCMREANIARAIAQGLVPR